MTTMSEEQPPKNDVQRYVGSSETLDECRARGFPGGDTYVRSEDYDALATRVATLEAALRKADEWLGCKEPIFARTTIDFARLRAAAQERGA